MKYIEIEYKISNENNKEYHMIHFEDENEVSLNMIENGKHAGHIETPLTSNIKALLKMQQGEQIRNGAGVTITITKRTEDTL